MRNDPRDSVECWEASGECFACMVGVWTGPESHSPGCSLANATPPDRVDAETHYIFYGDPDADGRQPWECTTCCSGGSVGEFADPEIAAERSHAKSGVTNLGRTSRIPS